MTMDELGMRLLELQAEFANHDLHTAHAAGFAQPGWGPRERRVIAKDFATTLAAFVALVPAGRGVRAGEGETADGEQRGGDIEHVRADVDGEDAEQNQ